MPLSLSRRSFLRTVAAGAGWLAVRPVFAAGADPNRVALLSDTHIPDAPEVAYKTFNMTDRLRTVVKEVVALSPKPTCVIIDGDFAYKSGTAGEYARAAEEVLPIQKAGIPLHIAMGNHDGRAEFRAGVKSVLPKETPVEGKHVLIIGLPRANLFLLDSLEKRIGVGGELGQQQLKWLASALDAHKDKPALVFAHHNPQWAMPADGKHFGLSDMPAAWDVLKARPHVKAYLFGHTHTWKLGRKDGVHLVNLPAVGYPFQANEVTGWTDMALTERGGKFTIRSLDDKHDLHNKTFDLSWE